jgi:toxin ParE1/3/4
VKRLVRRAQATDDLQLAFEYYFDAANIAVAERFRDEVDDAMAHIARHPGTGSPRYSQTVNGLEIRFWTLNKFPYSIFYFERKDYVEILRVLHQSSNIPVHLDP